jgi:hypothetical protein
VAAAVLLLELAQDPADPAAVPLDLFLIVEQAVRLHHRDKETQAAQRLQAVHRPAVEEAVEPVQQVAALLRQSPVMAATVRHQLTQDRQLLTPAVAAVEQTQVAV